MRPVIIADASRGGPGGRLGDFFRRYHLDRIAGAAWKIVLVLIVLAIVSGKAVVTVGPGERGVIFSKISGVLERELKEGWHIILPFLWEPTIYDVKQQSWTISIGEKMPQAGERVPEEPNLVALTSDGQQVTLDLTVRYHPDPVKVWRLHQRVGPEYLNKVIRPHTRRTARMVVSQYDVTAVYSEERRTIQHEIAEELSRVLQDEDIILDEFLLRHVKFTEQFQQAIEAKQVAVQEVEQMEYVLQAAEKEKESKIVEAEGEAEAIRLQGTALKQNPLLIDYEYARKVAPRVGAIIGSEDLIRR